MSRQTTGSQHNAVAPYGSTITTYVVLLRRVITSYNAHSYNALKVTAVKIKLSLCFNWTPRNEGILGEWRYSSTHSDLGAI